MGCIQLGALRYHHHPPQVSPFYIRKYGCKGNNRFEMAVMVLLVLILLQLLNPGQTLLSSSIYFKLNRFQIDSPNLSGFKLASWLHSHNQVMNIN